MPQEIERKFLPRTAGWRKRIETSQTISQGYLNTDPDSTVRVRLLVEGKKKTGWITIKGRNTGISRAEFEYKVPAKDAEEMLKMAGKNVISKTRHIVHYEGFKFEVDEFHDLNDGLVVIEVELPTEDTKFPTPKWLGEEVSHDPRYFNSQLLARPYSSWGGGVAAWPYNTGE